MSKELYRLFMMNFDMPEGGINDLYSTYETLADAIRGMKECDEVHFNEAHISKGFIIQKAYKLKDDKWIEIGDGFTHYE